MDEASLLTVSNKITKIVTAKGKRCVEKTMSGKRVANVCCFSASGTYV